MERDRDFEARIDTLRRRLREDRDLDALHAHFHEALGMHAVLHRHSVAARNELLEQCVTEAIHRIVRRKVGVLLIAFHVPEHGLWHGQAVGGGAIGTFFGFESSAQFCLGVMHDDERATFARMTVASANAPVNKVPFARAQRGQA